MVKKQLLKQQMHQRLKLNRQQNPKPHQKKQVITETVEDSMKT